MHVCFFTLIILTSLFQRASPSKNYRHVILIKSDQSIIKWLMYYILLVCIHLPHSTLFEKTTVMGGPSFYDRKISGQPAHTCWLANALPPITSACASECVIPTQFVAYPLNNVLWLLNSFLVFQLFEIGERIAFSK